MKLSFHGAAQDVTGSCHLIECVGRRILIDCGMLQGSRELDEENADPFGFDPASVDVVLLTHAHLDHSGRLPLLVKRGFRGEVIATSATFDLARLVILDVAHLHEEAASRRARDNLQRPNKQVEEPLFSLVDATNSFGRFGRAAEYNQPIQIAAGLTATFYDAGHILGSASILLEVDDQTGKHSILFSGDIGNAGRPLFRAPQTPPSAEIVVMESTYGDRLHRPFSETVAEFYEAIASALTAGGNVIIPTFALDRAQEILYFLRQGTEEGRIPISMPVFLDSPMAVSATEIFQHHPESYNEHLADFFKQGKDPFHVAGLKMVRERADSMAINQVQGGAVIMAGSGMCTGGRVLHHLRHNLWKPNASIIFVGYAAAGTLARQIIDGARAVKLFGDEIPVRAKVHTINGFSAHADQNELLEWHSRIAGKQTTFLVHGEAPVMKELARHLQGLRIEIPSLHQVFELS
jgi:metallo-beta-lactamase family protein